MHLVNLLSQCESNNIGACRSFPQFLQLSGFVKLLLVDLFLVGKRVSLLPHMPFLLGFQFELLEFRVRHFSNKWFEVKPRWQQ